MNNKKEIHFEVLAAIYHLENLHKCIDNAYELSEETDFLQDILKVASRNLGISKMKLLVASDLTKEVE